MSTGFDFELEYILPRSVDSPWLNIGTLTLAKTI